MIDDNRRPQDPIITPRPHICINMNDEILLVMEMLGSSLEHYRGNVDNPMPTPVLVNVFKKGRTCLEYLYDLGIIHRNVKPANICIGKRQDNTDVHRIDLGLSKLCKDDDSADGSNRDVIKDTYEFVGTPRYCSLNQHFRRSAVNSDGLEALSFSMMYLYNGILPWIFSPHPMTMKEPVGWVVVQKQKPVD